MSTISSNNIGSVVFWVNHVDSDWTTNDKAYNFQPISSGDGITVAVCKHRDKKLEIRISGPFSKTFAFVADVPAPGPSGIFVVLQWSDGKLTLLLNNQEIEIKDENSPLISWSGQAYSEKTDETTRTLETAIAFDMASNTLMEHVISAFHLIRNSSPGVVLSPIVVCDAFAIELYLKSLHRMDHNRGIRGHKLDELFGKLATATQQRIKDIYKAWPWPVPRPEQRTIPVGTSLEFDDVLRDCANSFAKWRYLFEAEPGSSGDNALYIASGIKLAVRDAACERHPTGFGKWWIPPLAETVQPPA